jgi:hypothetical protein
MSLSFSVSFQAAAAVGLINRFIWVWPEWDRVNHEHDHEVQDVYAGWRTYYPSRGQPFGVLCMCQRDHKVGIEFEDVNDEEEWGCVDDEPSKIFFLGGPMVKEQKCSRMVSGIMETIHEKKALEMLKNGGWITAEENILLDIDEDYYGCETSILPLLDAGLSEDFIQIITELIQNVMCVNDIKDELVADQFFHTIIDIILDFKAKLCVQQIKPADDDEEERSCLTDFEADKSLIQMIPEIMESFTRTGKKNILCHKGVLGSVMLQGLIRKLYDLKTLQLESLQYVGACLFTAPTSMLFQERSVHVCHGFNTPNQSAVNFHVPTQEENTERTALLKNTLTSLPIRPTLVTVCRSVRDGYTPWKFFTDIENSVVDTLKAAFPDITDSSVQYDENLLGGKRGWPGRHD